MGARDRDREGARETERKVSSDVFAVRIPRPFFLSPCVPSPLPPSRSFSLSLSLWLSRSHSLSRTERHVI